ncbi:MAG TPA: DUF1512 domain-containing protein [Acidilobales archaeon]|nr:DUF1512 domain-containing protein [Acidilobales archaeon]
MNGDNLSPLLWVLFILVLFLLNFTDIPQRMQLMRWSRFIRSKLAYIETLVTSSRNKTIQFISRVLKVSKAEEIVNNFIDNFFVIEPVDIEPTDIIRRLEHLLNVRDTKIKAYAEKFLPSVPKELRYNAIVALEITSVLNSVYKSLRHYFLLGIKHNNWALVMQLALIIPQLVKELEGYHRAIDSFTAGKPVGDSAGPLVAFNFIGLSERRPIAEDTVYSVVDFEGRKLYVIKAEGPGAAVGKPGEAVARIVEELKGRVARIITVDAALKLEGEESGGIAEGIGAAIGDPGPEKIKIERIASKYNIPVDAVIVKMSSEEAINEMTSKIYEGVKKAVEKVKQIILEKTRAGDIVVIAGIGNTVGVY